ncbi:hypothetical protein TRIUR3_19174 [Triticum urartu]|uniref:Uncharacterized protein n=1 Tax=Triticum urartu TaxID=4572 RepID=M7YPE6_TRIUA|nr:hypothetical protein TRIUR3_19174 [Triticum urartu]
MILEEQAQSSRRQARQQQQLLDLKAELKKQELRQQAVQAQVNVLLKERNGS